jgi:3-oxoacyl-[acyl-carrier-protein] synthase II
MHKNVGLINKDPECDLDFLTESKEVEVNGTISNSLGFGGHNASIVIKKFVE